MRPPLGNYRTWEYGHAPARELDRQVGVVAGLADFGLHDDIVAAEATSRPLIAANPLSRSTLAPVRRTGARL
jgi:hypothetical protein